MDATFLEGEPPKPPKTASSKPKSSMSTRGLSSGIFWCIFVLTQKDALAQVALNQDPYRHKGKYNFKRNNSVVVNTDFLYKKIKKTGCLHLYSL